MFNIISKYIEEFEKIRKIENWCDIRKNNVLEKLCKGNVNEFKVSH